MYYIIFVQQVLYVILIRLYISIQSAKLSLWTKYNKHSNNGKALYIELHTKSSSNSMHSFGFTSTYTCAIFEPRLWIIISTSVKPESFSFYSDTIRGGGGLRKTDALFILEFFSSHTWIKHKRICVYEWR